jgi:hypothetical protein
LIAIGAVRSLKVVHFNVDHVLTRLGECSNYPRNALTTFHRDISWLRRGVEAKAAIIFIGRLRYYSGFVMYELDHAYALVMGEFNANSQRFTEAGIGGVTF